jgi:hypothetical protein
MVQLDMTPCSSSKDVLSAALQPTADVMDLSARGMLALLMRGNQVRSMNREARWTKVHVVSGRRAGCECWLSDDAVTWDGKHIKGRGVVDPGTVCLKDPKEFDERFYLPGCCRDAGYRQAVAAQAKLKGPIQVIDGVTVQVRPAPFEVYVWRVTGKLSTGSTTTCWVPVRAVDLDDPEDYFEPY